MIVYFSATGNSKYVAKRIARAFDDTAVSIEKQDGSITLRENEILGIVTPVHWWQLPLPTREYLKKLNLTAAGQPYTFIVATCGTTPGCVFSDAERILQEKNIRLNAGFSVKMPDTWTPAFDLSDPERVARKNADAEEIIDSVIAGIESRTEGNHMKRTLPHAVRVLSEPSFDRARRTSRFYVEDTCSGCGLCARKCPVQAIRIKNRKPVWVKEQCALCLRCLHCCPNFSIQYGKKKKKKHGQYKNPHVRI